MNIKNCDVGVETFDDIEVELGVWAVGGRGGIRHERDELGELSVGYDERGITFCAIDQESSVTVSAAPIYSSEGCIE